MHAVQRLSVTSTAQAEPLALPMILLSCLVKYIKLPVADSHSHCRYKATPNHVSLTEHVEVVSIDITVLPVWDKQLDV